MPPCSDWCQKVAQLAIGGKQLTPTCSIVCRMRAKSNDLWLEGNLYRLSSLLRGTAKASVKIIVRALERACIQAAVADFEERTAPCGWSRTCLQGVRCEEHLLPLLALICFCCVCKEAGKEGHISGT